MNKNTYIYFKQGNDEGYFLKWRDKYCLISKEDKKLLEKNTWGYDASRDVWRAELGGKKKLLHRYIFGLDKGVKVVDHINHNRSDCRRVNLRVTSQAKNSYNRSLYSNNTTGVKGITKVGNKFRAQLNYKYRRIYLGVFESFEKACKARLRAEKKYHKEYRFNSIGAFNG